MFRTKLYTMKLYMFVDTVCVCIYNMYTLTK